MAPLTRCRASAGNVPNELNAEYYRQRASAGLIIGEATSVSPFGYGYPNTPGIHTPEQGRAFGIEVSRVPHGGSPSGPGVCITNYERMEAVDFIELRGLVLDESSILKAHDGKTRTKIIESAQGVPYRLSCTATPSPNDFEELGNQCEFLGVMTRTEMLATYFVNDTGDTNPEP